MSDLLNFCEQANVIISQLKGKEKLRTFINYRYRILLKKFPHEPFSVEQGDYDFFEVTQKYLSGELDISSITKSDYNNNYINWVKAHKTKKL